MTGAAPLLPLEGVTYPSEEQATRWLSSGAWSADTLGEAMRRAAADRPDHSLLITKSGRMSFAEVDAATEYFALAMRGLGLLAGDRVMFQMGNIAETAIALIGCAKAGLIPVCALPQHRDIEISALIQRTRPRAYIAQARQSRFDLAGFAARMAGTAGISPLIVAEAAKDMLPPGAIRFEDLLIPQSGVADAGVGAADLMMLQLSGGTTNLPKLIPRLHGEHLGQAAAWARRTRLDRNSVAIYGMPLIHNAGLVAMLYPAILTRSSLVLLPSVEPEEFCTFIERERVTHSMSIGPATIRLIDYDGIARHDLSSLQLLTNFSGAEPLERNLGATSLNIFGASEGMITATDPDSPAELRHHTVGWAMHDEDELIVLRPGTLEEAEPGEEGEFCFRGPSTIQGYFRAPEVNAQSFTPDGFFRSGDVIVREPGHDRRIFAFRGRMKDNIDRGGEKFGAEEVEVVISGHPDVLDVKVVAMPDKLLGERACAFLVIRPGATVPDVPTLGAWLTGRGLARFKLPERVEIIDAMPVTKVDKIDKQALRDLIARKLAEEAGAA